MKKDISIIIPIHHVSGNFETYFERAIKSIQNQVTQPTEVIIVQADNKEVNSWMTKWEKSQPKDLNIKLIKNTGKTDFCSQINLGVENSSTDWFSILEYDDEYSRNWVKNVHHYMDHYGSVDIFFPLVIDVNPENNFLGFTNEALWAMKFSEKLGFLDNNTLLNYQNFQISGTVYKKESFEDVGKFKPNFKLTFGYEFLLRATYNDLEIMTIPKIGYKHTNMREDSLFWNYKNKPTEKLSGEEGGFWIEAAKKEYFFTYDRDIKYEVQ
jgi:glycosyltransferase involved in cell wall biosynthesis